MLLSQIFVGEGYEKNKFPKSLSLKDEFFKVLLWSLWWEKLSVMGLRQTLDEKMPHGLEVF